MSNESENASVLQLAWQRCQTARVFGASSEQFAFSSCLSCFHVLVLAKDKLY